MVDWNFCVVHRNFCMMYSSCVMHWSHRVVYWSLSVVRSNCFYFVVALLWFNHYMMHNMFNNMNWRSSVINWLFCCVMYRSRSGVMDGLRVMNRLYKVLNRSLMMSYFLGRCC